MLKRDHRLAVCSLCAAAVSSLPRSGHQADNGDMETDTELIMNRGEQDIHQHQHYLSPSPWHNISSYCVHCPASRLPGSWHYPHRPPQSGPVWNPLVFLWQNQLLINISNYFCQLHLEATVISIYLPLALSECGVCLDCLVSSIQPCL